MASTLAPPRISLVVPMLNEEGNVAPLLERAARALEALDEPFEIICVNDGSVDRTLERLEEARVSRPWLVVLNLGENQGQHAAIASGFALARGDWIVTLDADLQNPPEEIPRLVRALREGHDLVGTFRTCRCDTLPRRAASRLVNALARTFAPGSPRDLGCMLRGYDAPLAREIARSARPGCYVPALALRLAQSPVEIPVRHAPRQAGASRYDWARLLRLLRDLVAAFAPRSVRVLLGGAVILGAGAGASLAGALATESGPESALLAALVVLLGAPAAAAAIVGESARAAVARPRDIARDRAARAPEARP